MKQLLLDLTGITSTDLFFNYFLDFVLIAFAIAIILQTISFITNFIRLR